MTNECLNCEQRDHESSLVHQVGGGYLCKRCHKNNEVNHPMHYQGDGVEAIDVIESFNLGFCLGNTIKYILRAGNKGCRVTDLKKALWYLEREIASSKAESE